MQRFKDKHFFYYPRKRVAFSFSLWRVGVTSQKTARQKKTALTIPSSLFRTVAILIVFLYFLSSPASPHLTLLTL